METVVGVGNIGFPSSPVFGINSNIAVRAKLAREMKVLSLSNVIKGDRKICYIPCFLSWILPYLDFI